MGEDGGGTTEIDERLINSTSAPFTNQCGEGTLERIVQLALLARAALARESLGEELSSEQRARLRAPELALDRARSANGELAVRAPVRTVSSVPVGVLGRHLEML